MKVPLLLYKTQTIGSDLYDRIISKHPVAIQSLMYALDVFDCTETFSLLTQQPNIFVTLSVNDSGISD